MLKGVQAPNLDQFLSRGVQITSSLILRLHGLSNILAGMLHVAHHVISLENHILSYHLFRIGALDTERQRTSILENAPFVGSHL